MEQRAERRKGKRAREPATVAGTIVQVQSWSVDRIKRELDEKGLHTCGLKRDLVARLAAAMANGGVGDWETVRRMGDGARDLGQAGRPLNMHSPQQIPYTPCA